MQDFSFLDKLRILMNVIVSSPFYIALIIALILVLITVLLSFKLKRVINKWIYIGIWLLFFATILVIYHEFFVELIDNLFDTMFMALYFPNLATYIIIIFVSNAFFIYSIFSKKMVKAFKIINITNTVLVDIFLILIIGVISKNGINVYDEITVYTNSSLLVLLELSSALFTSWLLLNLFTSAYYKLKKKDNKEEFVSNNVAPEIIFDWVRP